MREGGVDGGRQWMLHTWKQLAVFPACRVTPVSQRLLRGIIFHFQP